MVRAFILSLLMLTVGCGVAVSPIELDPTPEPIPAPGPAPEVQKVRLAIFSAQWCQPCKTLAGKLSKEMNALPSETRKKVSWELYVVTGPNPSSKPTQADADYYKSKYLPSVDLALPDVGMSNYRKWKAGSGSIPAAVVLKGDNVVAHPQSDELDILEAVLENLE